MPDARSVEIALFALGGLREPPHFTAPFALSRAVFRSRSKVALSSLALASAESFAHS